LALYDNIFKVQTPVQVLLHGQYKIT